MAEDIVKCLAEDAALWSVGEVSTAELVRLACDALIEGLDSQALRELAGAPAPASQFEIEELLERVADDFDFVSHMHGSASGQLAAAKLLAARCVLGRAAPRDIARWMHTRIGHGHDDPIVEELVSLDHRYDTVADTGKSEAIIDSAFLAAAKKLVGT